MKRKAPADKIIRSALYGNMEFSGPEMRFIESFYLQRLRHVSQMGMLYLVYPDARHSRFEHSLGVVHSLKSLLKADRAIQRALSREQVRTLIFASLLHDSGHGPFSHTTETLLHMSGLDLHLRRVGGDEGNSVKPHERRCRDMIQDSDFHLANLDIDSYGIKATFDSLGVDSNQVAGVILGLKSSPLLNLLSGDFDVDKMDYFRRDAFFTGTLGGGVDMEAIQRWISVFDRDGYPLAAFDQRLVGHLLHLLYSREHVYNVTAYHPVVRIVSALILVAGDMALRALPPDIAALIYSNIELLDDREFLSALEIAAPDASDKAEGPILKRLVQRLYLRRLPKRLCTLTRGEFVHKFGESIPFLEARSNGALPGLVYSRISQIGDGRYVKMLAGKTDDVAILELSPEIGGISQWAMAATSDKSPLSRILISKTNGEPVPLSAWLELNAGPGSADAHAHALQAFRLSVWRAIVLVPASLKFELKSQGLEDSFVDDFARAVGNPLMCRPLGIAQSQLHTQKLIAEKVTGWRDQLATSKGLSK